MNLAARIVQLFHDVFGTYPVLTWTVVACLIGTIVCLAVGIIARHR